MKRISIEYLVQKIEGYMGGQVSRRSVGRVWAAGKIAHGLQPAWPNDIINEFSFRKEGNQIALR
jgi:hypothetical protein